MEIVSTIAAISYELWSMGIYRCNGHHSQSDKRGEQDQESQLFPYSNTHLHLDEGSSDRLPSSGWLGNVDATICNDFAARGFCFPSPVSMPLLPQRDQANARSSYMCQPAQSVSATRLGWIQRSCIRDLLRRGPLRQALGCDHSSAVEPLKGKGFNVKD